MVQCKYVEIGGPCALLMKASSSKLLNNGMRCPYLIVL